VIANQASGPIITVRLARQNELPRSETCSQEGDFAREQFDPLVAFARRELFDDEGEIVTTRLVRLDEASIIRATSGIDVAVQPRTRVGNMVISYVYPTSIASKSYCLHVRDGEIIVERR
jgi:hypothetical protein